MFALKNRKKLRARLTEEENTMESDEIEYEVCGAD
jgi:hypothetical protein